MSSSGAALPNLPGPCLPGRDRGVPHLQVVSTGGGWLQPARKSRDKQFSPGSLQGAKAAALPWWGQSRQRHHTEERKWHIALCRRQFDVSGPPLTKSSLKSSLCGSSSSRSNQLPSFYPKDMGPLAACSSQHEARQEPMSPWEGTAQWQARRPSWGLVLPSALLYGWWLLPARCPGSRCSDCCCGCELGQRRGQPSMNHVSPLSPLTSSWLLWVTSVALQPHLHQTGKSPACLCRGKI